LPWRFEKRIKARSGEGPKAQHIHSFLETENLRRGAVKASGLSTSLGLSPEQEKDGGSRHTRFLLLPLWQEATPQGPCTTRQYEASLRTKIIILSDCNTQNRNKVSEWKDSLLCEWQIASCVWFDTRCDLWEERRMRQVDCRVKSCGAPFLFSRFRFRDQFSIANLRLRRKRDWWLEQGRNEMQINQTIKSLSSRSLDYE
jgi:hypothetical protein